MQGNGRFGVFARSAREEKLENVTGSTKDIHAPRHEDHARSRDLQIVYRRLEDANERFRVLAESSLTGIYLIQEGRFRYVNPAMARMFGYTVDEVVDRLAVEHLVYPDDRPMVAQNIRQRLDGVVEEIRYELRGLRKDGSVFPVEVHGRRAELGGKIGVMGTLADNTERKRTEEVLRESEARLEEAQRIAHVGWWERNFKTNRVSLSDEVCRIFGVQPVDLPQWHERWLNLIHPDDKPRTTKAAAAALLPGGSPYDVEYRVVRPDRTVRRVHSQGEVTWDDSGRPLRQFGVLQDITELRHAEDELRASEARFRSFVDHATDAFFLHDHELIIVDINRQACESLGYTREELIGMHPRDFDVGFDEAAVARLAERVHAGETISVESVHRRKDGMVFPVEIRASQFEQGGQRFFLGLVRDITERKRAEQGLREREAKIRRLVDANIIGICIWERGGPILDANDAFLRMVGYDRNDLIAGRLRRDDLTPPEWRDRTARGVAELEMTGTIRPYEKEYFRKDGSRVPVLLGAAGFDETANQGVMFVLDLTERKRAEADAHESERRYRQVQMELEHASRVMTMGELTASIAHEINQPLTGLVTSGEACLQYLTDPRDIEAARRAVERMIRDALRAAEVISRIRTLARKSDPRKDQLSINNVVLETASLVRTELQRNGVSLAIKLADDLPSVLGDQIQLQQVVLNLMMNAKESMSEVIEAPRELVITSEQITPKEVLVTVRDSGPGFDADKADKIFEAFHTTKATGMGMGLTISRSIIEAHGGRLWAAQNQPRGAAFHFSLPVWRNDE